MSTGLECVLVERWLEEWYYILENMSSPKLAWSWMDYAKAYGPFESKDKALKHLSDNHPNPGGFSVVDFSHYGMLSDNQKQPYEDLIKYASKQGTNVIQW